MPVNNNNPTLATTNFQLDFMTPYFFLRRKIALLMCAAGRDASTAKTDSAILHSGITPFWRCSLGRMLAFRRQTTKQPTTLGSIVAAQFTELYLVVATGAGACTSNAGNSEASFKSTNRSSRCSSCRNLAVVMAESPAF